MLGFEGTVPDDVEQSQDQYAMGRVILGLLGFECSAVVCKRVNSRHAHRKLCRVGWEEFSRL